MRIANIGKKFPGFVALLFASSLQVGLGQVQEKWVSRYNGVGNAVDVALSVKVDSLRNVYVAGYSDGAGTGKDFVTVKYNASGAEQWVRTYNGPGNGSDSTAAMAIDNSGNVYVCGPSMNANQDYATIKYNPDGDTIWVRRYNGPGNNYDIATAIAVDALANVYVTGCSWGGNPTGANYLTIKYRPNGDTAWVRRYNPQDNFIDKPTAIAVDNSGNVCVTGWTAEGLTGSDWYATVKYDSNGVQQWERQEGSGWDEATAICIDSSGNVYVTGTFSGGSGIYDYGTFKYNAAGVKQWGRRYNGPANSHDGALAIAVGDSGNIYVTGYSLGSGTNYDFATIKYRPDSVQLWVRRYNGPGYGPDWGTALVAGGGYVYVTGLSVESGGSQDYTTIKYNGQGDSLWHISYDGPAGGQDMANAVAIDDSHNIYITGVSPGASSDKDYATIKYTQPLGIGEGHFGTAVTAPVLELYPVPCRTSVILKINRRLDRMNETTNIDIFDIGGKLVKTEHPGPEPRQKISLAGLGAGVYFLRLKIDNREIIEKIIVTK